MRNFTNAMRSNVARTVASVRRGGSKLAVAGTALVASGSASAAATFDPASITTKINDNGAQAVLIVGAFILAVWGLKAMGLFKRG